MIGLIFGETDFPKYIYKKIKGKKNYLLEDIHDVEESINDTIKEDSIKEEEIVPIINKDN